MHVSKPFADSCEQNKGPILDVLRQVFAQPATVLEIGSGTGQHAVFFAEALAHLTWQPSDVAENLPGIELWLRDASLPNVRPPLLLDVARSAWPSGTFDGAFSANTAHIMSWPEVERMFDGVSRVLASGGLFCLYGPFNYHGCYTAPSNERFDQWLRARSPHMGVRDVDDLQQAAGKVGMVLTRDFEMPADNRTLVWSKN